MIDHDLFFDSFDLNNTLIVIFSGDKPHKHSNSTLKVLQTGAFHLQQKLRPDSLFLGGFVSLTNRTQLVPVQFFASEGQILVPNFVENPHVNALVAFPHDNTITKNQSYKH